MDDGPRQTGFLSCICCNLISGVRPICTPGSKNELVDVETNSVTTSEYQTVADKLVTVNSSEADPSRTAAGGDEASLKFIEDLECTVDRVVDHLKILL
jgi:hypothetical protein